MDKDSKLKISQDQSSIDNISAHFFDLFTNKNGRVPKVKDIKNLFIKDGLIISNTDGNPKIYNLDSFIQPREEMLNNGTLTDFSEAEISQETKIFGNIAQRFCQYEKSGKLHGKAFKSKGMKTLQFVKINQEWKLSSVAWCDIT